MHRCIDLSLEEPVSRKRRCDPENHRNMGIRSRNDLVKLIFVEGFPAKAVEKGGARSKPRAISTLDKVTTFKA